MSGIRTVTIVGRMTHRQQKTTSAILQPMIQFFVEDGFWGAESKTTSPMMAGPLTGGGGGGDSTRATQPDARNAKVMMLAKPILFITSSGQ